MSQKDRVSPTGRQIAAARALLGMGQTILAASAHISVATLKRMEASVGTAAGMSNNVRAVVAALEDAGIRLFRSDGTIGIFLASDDNEPKTARLSELLAQAEAISAYDRRTATEIYEKAASEIIDPLQTKSDTSDRGELDEPQAPKPPKDRSKER